MKDPMDIIRGIEGYPTWHTDTDAASVIIENAADEVDVRVGIQADEKPNDYEKVIQYLAYQLWFTACKLAAIQDSLTQGKTDVVHSPS